MISQRSISRFTARAGFLNQTSRIFGPRFESRPCPFDVKQDYNVFSGLENPKGQAPVLANAEPGFLGTLGMKLGFLKVNDKVFLPSALSFRSDIHSACPKEFDTVRNTRSVDFEKGTVQENERDMGRSQLTRSMDFGRGTLQENGRDMGGSQFTRSGDFGRGTIQENGRVMGDSQLTRSMDYVRGIIQENGRDMGGSQLSRYSIEKDADIVHVKLIRNNAFVTVTDSKGNKKIGASSGCLSTKVSRYAAEATAEHVGRLAKNMGLKSFVVKVNGFTHFKRKKQAILSFRDGYTNSRSDQNPIVYIEDTTRRAHNGCRLRKKRRV